MQKLSMRWMVVTAIGAIAPQAFAQTDATTSAVPPPSGKVPATASTAAPASAPVQPVSPEAKPGEPTTDATPGAKPDAATSSLSVEAAASTESTPAASAAAAGPAGANAAESSGSRPWMEQLLPFDGQIELGLTAGLLFPGNVNLKDQYKTHQTLATAPELGLRGAYFPIQYVGGELEYVTGFSKTNTDGNSATTWALRFQVIGQYPAWRVTPFALLGFGRIGVFSNSVGNDGDPLFHFGVGAKAALTPSVLVRLDLRDNMSQKFGASNGSQAHSPEILLGVSMILGRVEAPPANAVLDSDGDGLVDRVDKCPNEPGVGADGCPVKDADADGIVDSDDKCPDVKGIAPDGCPAVKDTDGDGVPDDKDKCVDVKGDLPDGCPSDKDSDGDGIIDSKDKCPNEAETKNGYEDADGCPDELPAQVKSFAGVIQGIEFDRDKASIRPTSTAALDKSADVLAAYPSLRVLIVGHTDDTGPREKNVQLSKDRAEAVKAYLVGKGVAPERLETKGAGPDEPLDSNATAAGRQRNRRIEFRLIKD